MAERGKTIQIYLPDGNPRSIKICEITSSITRGILIPRNKLKDAARYIDLSKVGIYFLFSEKNELSQFQVYLGEAEDLLKRVKQHDNQNEDYWNFAVCFISDKENLNKAHVKFLENYCYQKAKIINRCLIKNSVIPTASSITKQEEDFVLDFFDELKILLGTLNYPIFEEIKKELSEDDVFYCRGKDSNASGNLTEEGFVVYSGSKANIKLSASAGSWLENMQEKMINEGILVQEENVLKFDKDFIFNSPSAAAGVVLGRRANGWTEWKNQEGKTLDEIKRRKEDL